MKICKYVLGMHRSSDIEGVFLMSDEELNIAKELDGFEVYYGEIAGKHSEVSCTLHFEHIEVLSEKEEEVAFFKKILPHGAGFPFKDYWFNTDRASEAGWEEGYSKHYKNAEEALAEYGEYNNSIMKNAFIEGFRKAREK